MVFFFPQHDRRWLELPVLQLGQPLVDSPSFSGDGSVHARLGRLLNGERPTCTPARIDSRCAMRGAEPPPVNSRRTALSDTVGCVNIIGLERG